MTAATAELAEQDAAFKEYIAARPLVAPCRARLPPAPPAMPSARVAAAAVPARVAFNSLSLSFRAPRDVRRRHSLGRRRRIDGRRGFTTPLNPFPASSRVIGGAAARRPSGSRMPEREAASSA